MYWFSLWILIFKTKQAIAGTSQKRPVGPSQPGWYLYSMHASSSSPLSATFSIMLCHVFKWSVLFTSTIPCGVTFHFLTIIWASQFLLHSQWDLLKIKHWLTQRMLVTYCFQHCFLLGFNTINPKQNWQVRVVQGSAPGLLIFTGVILRYHSTPSPLHLRKVDG